MRALPQSLILEPTLNPFSLENDTPTKNLFNIEEFFRTPTTPRTAIPNFGLGDTFSFSDSIAASGPPPPPPVLEGGSSETLTDDKSLSSPELPGLEEPLSDQGSATPATTDIYPLSGYEFTKELPQEWTMAEIANFSQQIFPESLPALTSDSTTRPAAPAPVKPLVVVPYIPASDPNSEAEVKKPARGRNSALPPAAEPLTTNYNLSFYIPKISEEEKQRRLKSEEAFKEWLQKAELTEFQQRYINDANVRESSLMASRNYKACSTCGILPSTVGKYAYHFEDHGCKEGSKNTPREYCDVEGCPYMAIGFSSRQTHSRHKNSVHMGIKHTCSRCSRQFARKDGLARHWALGTCKKNRKKSTRKSREARRNKATEPPAPNGPKPMAVSKRSLRPRAKAL